MLTVLIQHFSSLQQQPSKTFPFCFRFRWFSFSWITFSCNMQQALLLLCSNFCYCVDIYLNFFRLISNFWVSLVSLVSRGNLLSSRPLVDHYYIHWKYPPCYMHLWCCFILLLLMLKISLCWSSFKLDDISCQTDDDIWKCVFSIKLIFVSTSLTNMHSKEKEL